MPFLPLFMPFLPLFMPFLRQFLPFFRPFLQRLSVSFCTFSTPFSQYFLQRFHSIFYAFFSVCRFSQCRFAPFLHRFCRVSKPFPLLFCAAFTTSSLKFIKAGIHPQFQQQFLEVPGSDVDFPSNTNHQKSANLPETPIISMQK